MPRWWLGGLQWESDGGEKKEENKIGVRSAHGKGEIAVIVGGPPGYGSGTWRAAVICAERIGRGAVHESHGGRYPDAHQRSGKESP